MKFSEIKILLKVIRSDADHINLGVFADHLDWILKVTDVELKICDDCGWGVPVDAAHETLNNNTICPSCYDRSYFTCEGCGDILHNRYANEGVGGDSYCQDCFDDRFTCCTHCGQVICQSESCERHGEDHCSSCADEDDESEDLPHVLQYDTDVTEYFERQWLSAPHEATDFRGNGRSKTPTLWMGFELEITTKSNNASDAVHKALAGRGILKSDCSIEGTGFEIVSLPGTLLYHQQHWGDIFFNTIRKHCRGWTEDSCGMHVHISKAALTRLQIGRLTLFLNSEENRPFVEKVAGRSAGEYCRVYTKTLTSVDRDKQDRDENERHQAVNLGNDATVEIRIFQSNVAKLGFLKNIDFCAALVQFCAETSNQALTSADFLLWLDSHRGAYPYLIKWAVREKLITLQHKERTPLAFAA